jgi:hypothetical protein
MFNSREYEWADITLILGGVDITGIRAIKYKKKTEREPVYAKGRDPHSIQTGNNSYEGEFEVLQSDFNALSLAAGGDITNLNVNAVVAYGNPANGDVMKTDILSGIRFTEAENAAKQGDKFMPVTLPFMFTGLKKVL